MKLKSFVLSLSILLSACGGGGGGGGGGVQDSTAPSMESFTVRSSGASTYTLEAVATDSVGVTGYCFKTDATTPKATDSCWQVSAQNAGVSMPTGTIYRVWAKDAAGNVSTPLSTLGDVQPPVLTAITTKDVSGATMTLLANATDNTAVTAYCFKTSNAAPLASDSCFQSSNQKTGVTLSASTTQWVWAKDAAGNVSSGMRGPCSAAGYAASDLSTKKTVCMMTDKGEIVLEMESANTNVAQTVANFLNYVNFGFYSNTTFHRVTTVAADNLAVVQGGGFNYVSGTGYVQKSPPFSPITLESPYSKSTGLSNTRGTIAMARQIAADTATSQFYINVVDNIILDGSSAGSPGYAVFGKVLTGMDVVDLIKVVPVGSGSFPVTPIFVQWAYQLK